RGCDSSSNRARTTCSSWRAARAEARRVSGYSWITAAGMAAHEESAGMTSEHTQGIVKYYTRRHSQRRDAFDRPYANYGYWTRPGLSMADAAEAMAGLVAGAAGLGPQDEVLEVGCGYGACAVR